MRVGGYEIGALLRSQFRRTCWELGLEFKEDKGWFDSGFRVEGEREQIIKLNNWLDFINKKELLKDES